MTNNLLMGKLVRDGVPGIIRRSGREPEIKRISGEELKAALKEKLVEEALEFKDSSDVYEELADVLEVVDAIIDEFGIDRVKLDEAKKEKHRRAGGFKDGYYLADDNRKA